ncbi:MAG: hypothetical protein HY721_33120 [Planctomycetes bacterium]|nr:hypothetical protein [Planctomycetota bacterium]
MTPRQIPTPPAAEESQAIPPEDMGAARALLGLEDKWLQAFRAEDPFNDGLEVSGCLAVKPDHRYGALAIVRVAGQPAPQVVQATPKLHYPFDKAGTFRFPPVQRITFYEKLDGTNVLAYRYRDAAGKSYLSYKLRLAPFLRNGRWGDFLDLWRELLARHPTIPQLVERSGCHVSFEMYGSRNTHLIEYEASLEAAVLFGVDSAWRVCPPHRMDLLGVPAAARIGELVAGEDPVARYRALREALEERNRPGEEGRIVGLEGAVWHVEARDGTVSMWKCKPESVEAIHWAAGINKEAVLATCRNLLETQDVLTFDALKPLLLEEYGEEDIEAFRVHIDDCIRQVQREVEYTKRVLEAYAGTGLSIVTHKAEVMRALSTRFDRGEMKKVYTTIVRSLPRGEVAPGGPETGR